MQIAEPGVDVVPAQHGLQSVIQLLGWTGVTKGSIVTIRIVLFSVSATYSFPVGSKQSAFGVLNLEEVPIPFAAPVDPFPAIVVTIAVSLFVVEQDMEPEPEPEAAPEAAGLRRIFLIA